MKEKRAQRLQDAMGLQPQHAVLLHNPSNMFYISGYRGEGLVLVSGETRAIITDFRYTEQAEQQAPGFAVHMTGNGKTHESIVNDLCLGLRVDKVFYEDGYVTVGAFQRLQNAVKGVEWRSINGAVEELRVVKDEGELALMEKACRITGEAFQRILPQIRVGVTEKQLANLLEFDMRTNGAEGVAFSTIVAAGVNGSLPHASPSDYKIQKGDMITLDFGAKVDGYCADMTRTVALGAPSDEMKRVYETVQQAQQMAQDAVRAGASCRKVDAIARDYIDSKGYQGRFGHGLGHSLGIDIHEDPRFNTLTTATLKENQMMTVEPGIYIPGVGGVRIENSVVVQKDGCRSFTLPTRDLIIL